MVPCAEPRAGRNLCSTLDRWSAPNSGERSLVYGWYLASGWDVVIVSFFFAGPGPAGLRLARKSGRRWPDDVSSRHRPTIGVALEGGGALGLAHIGVLQWFEDHHIPIDYVAGTSMGGLVGGLYASGKSPQQLKELVKAQNWDVILGGAIPYEDLSFRRKEDKVAFPNSIVLGLRRGLALPGGLNAGQQISLLIDRETLPYSGVNPSTICRFPSAAWRPTW